jgi:hypothetical protein
MKNRDLMVIFFLIAGVACVVSGLLSMYVSILSSWRYSVVCYVAFGFFIILGYMIFSDSSWYITPIRMTPMKASPVKVVADKQVIKSNNTKASATSKVEKSRIEIQKKRKGAKK